MPHDNNNNRAIGIRKSQFNADTVIPADAFLDFVVSGDNIRIKFSDFIAAIGVTGSIVQVGNVLDAPVLDTQGAVNGIRNIAGGFGITTSVNASNSVEISTDFTFDTTGAELVNDPLAPAPEFRSLVQNAGILISESAGKILVAADFDVLTPKSLIIVNQESQFGTPSAGQFILIDRKTYFLGAEITTVNNFKMGVGTKITSTSVSQNTLTYTGVGFMFDAVDTTFNFSNVSLNCPNARFLNAENTADQSGIGAWSNVSITSCLDLGIVANMSLFVVNDLLCQASTGGFQIGGSNFAVGLTQFVQFSAGGPAFTGIDLTDSVNVGLNINSHTVISFAPGATQLAGLANNGNIAPGSIGNVSFSRAIAAGPFTIDALSGITEDDVRYAFQRNDGIRDTQPFGLVTLSVNTVPTVVTGGLPSKVAGTWVCVDSSHYDCETNGTFNYLGENDVPSAVTVTMSLDPANGTNKDIALYLGKNGSIFPGIPAIIARIDAGNPQSITTLWEEEIVTSDAIEVFVANLTDNVSVIARNAIFRVS